MAVLSNRCAVSIFHQQQYAAAGWTVLLIDISRYTEALEWIADDNVEGEFDYQGSMLSQVFFWISDSDVAFEFKLRFG